MGSSMSACSRVWISFVVLMLAPAIVKAQFGKSGLIGLNGANAVLPSGAVGGQLPVGHASPKVILPSSATADAVRQQLDAGVSLESIDCALVELDVVLS